MSGLDVFVNVIPNTKTLALSNENKIIIDNTATSKLIVESGGKLVLDKAGKLIASRSGYCSVKRPAAKATCVLVATL